MPLVVFLKEKGTEHENNKTIFGRGTKLCVFLFPASPWVRTHLPHEAYYLQPLSQLLSILINIIFLKRHPYHIKAPICWLRFHCFYIKLALILKFSSRLVFLFPALFPVSHKLIPCVSIEFLKHFWVSYLLMKEKTLFLSDILWRASWVLVNKLRETWSSWLQIYIFCQDSVPSWHLAKSPLGNW